jgi:hypothetical protein
MRRSKHEFWKKETDLFLQGHLDPDHPLDGMGEIGRLARIGR